MSLRDAMRESAAQYLQPGEQIQAVLGAQTASPLLAGLTGVFVFLSLNRFRIIAVPPARIVDLDEGKISRKKARGIVTELPRSTRLGPGTGDWHRLPVGAETLRVHRRFFKDLDTADAAMA